MTVMKIRYQSHLMLHCRSQLAVFTMSTALQDHYNIISLPIFKFMLVWYCACHQRNSLVTLWSVGFPYWTECRRACDRHCQSGQ